MPADSASEMTYIVSGGALNSTHSLSSPDRRAHYHAELIISSPAVSKTNAPMHGEVARLSGMENNTGIIDL